MLADVLYVVITIVLFHHSVNCINVHVMNMVSTYLKIRGSCRLTISFKFLYKRHLVQILISHIENEKVSVGDSAVSLKHSGEGGLGAWGGILGN